ncbi:SCO family protein [Halobacillus litoralis]|uniref:SCO family protein n=1 Tax=Halobacillus litoralis TaxID=45668 RepID=UPI002492F7B2|nr:SCO family protein [Halobacillus litoralis]
MKLRIWFGMVILLLIVSACGSPIEENMSRNVDQMTTVNQHGNEVKLPEYFKGDYWIADFIFTNCDTVCPPMTGNMSRLQNQLKEENLEVPLVSVSVDPKNDTPEELVAFSKDYQPDYEQWDFLTGYTFQEVKEWSIKSFQSPLKKLPDSNQVAHGTSFYLVTPEGEVIKSYSGTDADSVTKIVEDLKTLKK